MTSESAVKTHPSRGSTLDHESVWENMRRLLDRTHDAFGSNSVVDDCLDIIVDLLGADRGLIVLTSSDGGWQVVNARGGKEALGPAERQEASKTVIRHAIETRRCAVWNLSAGDSAPTSFRWFGILAALAAPLYSGSDRSRPCGALYVDFRHGHELASELHVEFFTAASTIVGTALSHQDKGEIIQDRVRDSQVHCVNARATASLEDLLAPPSMRAVKAQLHSAVAGTAPILVLGESGTGKTLFARAIAEASGRRPIVRVVLGSSDDLNTITSELFGHERGAFSGAGAKRVGLVEYAHGGTLILDEILNMPPNAQQLLLDFAQFGAYRPLGYSGQESKHASVRIVSATNGDLVTAIRDQRFRADLYYRLAAVTIRLPALRDRRQDVPDLAEQALRRIDAARGWSLSPAARRMLTTTSTDWPGNVRQLERVIECARERAIARDPMAAVVTPADLDLSDTDPLAHFSTVPSESPSSAWQQLRDERAALDDRERRIIQDTLLGTDGAVARAARALGIARTTLLSRMEVLGLRDRG